MGSSTILQRAAGDWLALPATLAQERELRGSVGGVAWRNLAIGWRMAGELRAARLTRCLGVLAERHEVLRSGIAEFDGEVVQLVAPSLRPRLEVIDLRARRGRLRARGLRRCVAQRLRRPFALSEPPLWRPTLFRLGHREHVLVLVVSHTVWDAYSSIVAADEITRIYAGAPLAELPVQVGDIAAWEHAAGDGEADAFWTKELSAEPRLVPLPIDRDRAGRRNYRGRDLPLPPFAPWVGRSLQALAQTEATTLAVTFLAAFALLLRGAGTQDRIVIGLDEANRDRIETRGLIGYLLNVLPVRVDLAGCRTFRDVVLASKTAVARTYAHRLPLRRLISLARPGATLYEATLNVRPYDSRLRSVRIARSRSPVVTPWQPPVAWANFGMTSAWWDAHLDLSLDVQPAGAITGELSYNTEAIRPELADRLAGDLSSLVRRVAHDPDRDVAGLVATEP